MIPDPIDRRPDRHSIPIALACFAVLLVLAGICVMTADPVPPTTTTEVIR